LFNIESCKFVFSKQTAILFYFMTFLSLPFQGYSWSWKSNYSIERKNWIYNLKSRICCKFDPQLIYNTYHTPSSHISNCVFGIKHCLKYLLITCASHHFDCIYSYILCHFDDTWLIIGISYSKRSIIVHW